jgi:hypothetical protein
LYERPAVELEERERRGKPPDERDQGRREEQGKHAPEEVARPGATGDVDELFERERAEDFVLHFDELRNLELHRDE